MTDNLQNDPQKRARIKELCDLLNRASEAYYGGEEEIISNYEWDSFFDELSSLEKETGFILADSPTQRVGSERDVGEKPGNREVHEFPALSLAKTKSVSQLQEWAGDRPVFLSYKLDGLTLVLTYDQGTLQKVVTRGNGTAGNNITELWDSIEGIPGKVAYTGHLVLR